MKASLAMTLAQERGALTAVASVEAPDVRVETPVDGPVTVVIEEGGVRVDLSFPDATCVARFGRRVRAVCAPDDPVRRPRS